MSKNPENLYQRKGVWWIRYSEGGEKVRRSLGTKSKREAIRLRDLRLGKRTRDTMLARELGTDLAKVREALGDDPEPQQGRAPLFARVAQRWLDDKAAGDVREQTLKQARGLVTNWINPTFGRHRVDSITLDDHVLPWLAHLKTAKPIKGRRKGLSGTVRAQLFRTLSSIFRFAIRRRWATANPCEQLGRNSRPKQRAPRDVALTPAEAEALLGQLEGALRCKVMLGLYAGLRWGEVCGLAWADVDFEGAEINVCRSYQGPTKTKASTAAVPIHPDLAAELRLWQDECSSELWVFPEREDKPAHQMKGRDRNALKKAAERADIAKNLTPHVLRHTCGSWAYEATQDPEAVRKLMRHSKIQTTLAIYVHVDDESTRRAVAALPSLRRRPRLHAV